jgi:hypothetical protein
MPDVAAGGWVLRAQVPEGIFTLGGLPISKTPILCRFEHYPVKLILIFCGRQIA